MASRRRKRVLVSLLTLIGLALFLEGGARYVLRDDVRIEKLRTFLREGDSRFDPHPFTGFVLKDRDPKDPTRPRSWSFEKAKQPGKPRIACLGGSTTAGGYPLAMKKVLEEKTPVEFDVQNWGVDGWSTIESMVNYFINVQDYAPDCVVIHHSLNDIGARRRNDYRNDYAHWRRPWKERDVGVVTRAILLRSDLCAGLFVRSAKPGFQLKDYVDHPFRGLRANGKYEELPPGTQQGFMRNVRTIAEHAEAHGAVVALFTMPYLPEEGDTLWEACVEEHNQFLRDLAEERGYVLIDGDNHFEENADELLPLFIDRVHMVPEGRHLKGRLAAEALIEDGRILRAAEGAGEELGAAAVGRE